MKPQQMFHNARDGVKTLRTHLSAEPYGLGMIQLRQGKFNGQRTGDPGHLSLWNGEEALVLGTQGVQSLINHHPLPSHFTVMTCINQFSIHLNNEIPPTLFHTAPGLYLVPHNTNIHKSFLNKPTTGFFSHHNV